MPLRMRTFESRVFLGLVLITSAAFLWMVRGFLMPVFWAAVFAVLFRPAYLRLVRALRGRAAAAAGVTTLLVVLVVVIPAALLFTAVAQQALWLYNRVATGQINLNAPVEYAERLLPALTTTLGRYGVDIDQLRTSLESSAAVAAQFIATRALILGQNALTTAVMFGLMLYLLFFFFRDGDRIIAGIIRALPMGDEREDRLLRKFAEVSRATVKGTLVVAAAQGALGGIMFSVVGIQAAVFWGVVMGVLSLLPAVGAALVWIPAAVILIATGAYWQALVVIVGGTLVIGLVDNLLRPILVGRATEMPDYLVLLATLGGLSVFGLAGFVAGPILAALFLVMWEMFAAEYAPLDAAPALTVGGPPSPQPPSPQPPPSRDPRPAADPQPPAQAAAQLPSREQVDAPA
jgi:predicted PurR-regulated permease PerM